MSKSGGASIGGDTRRVAQLEDELRRLKNSYSSLSQEHAKLQTNYQILDKKTERKNSRIDNLQSIVDGAKEQSLSMHQLVVSYEHIC